MVNNIEISASRAKITLRKSVIFGAIYGVSWTIKIPVVGTLYLAEVFSLLSLPFLITHARVANTVELRRFSIAYFFLLAGLVVADLWNATNIQDSLRGWASVVSGYSSLVFLIYLLRKNIASIYWVLGGLAIAKLITGDIDDFSSALEYNLNFFKSNIAPSLFLIVILCAAMLNKYSKRLVFLFLVSAAILFIYLGARSAGLVLFLSGFIMWLHPIILSRNIILRLLSLLTFLAAILCLYFLYVNKVLDSPDRSNSYIQLSRLENPYNPITFLAAARTDVVVALAAIQEVPIVGRGSWAGDESGRFSEMFSDLQESSAVTYWGFIRSHSIIFTAWLWGGVLSLLGAILMGWLASTTFLKALKINSSASVIAVVLGVDLFWNYFFSPFGHIRTSVPFALGLLIVCVNLHQPNRRMAGDALEDN